VIAFEACTCATVVAWDVSRTRCAPWCAEQRHGLIRRLMRGEDDRMRNAAVLDSGDIGLGFSQRLSCGQCSRSSCCSWADIADV
jgi:hypothetical protein